MNIVKSKVILKDKQMYNQLKFNMNRSSFSR